jgi:adenylate cyclase
MFGTIGDASRLEYTVIGEPVNLAAKLEKHTKAESVRALCALDAYQLARSQGYEPPSPHQSLGRRDVAGLDEPVDLVALAPAV